MIKSVRHLVEQFVPAHYVISLNLTKRIERVFYGEVTIAGKLTSENSELLLHSLDLVIIESEIDGERATSRAGQDDELALSTGETLNAGEHIIKIKFEGKITDKMQGIYPCYFKDQGQDKELLMTQLESHSAREVFPCIDEPAAKAYFDLTLITEPNITVISNTPPKTSQATDGLLTTVFDTTPKMSTYLLAFVAGDLKYTETTNKHGVLIRAYSTPEQVENTRFALQLAADSLDDYDEYFALPYPLQKCDLVAVPDFAAGAMENWGLITFRESCMLVDKKHSSPDVKEYVSTVVVHELAHQWFGNLVTMKWWDDLWLNESFAKWCEHYFTDKLHPEWRLWEQFGAQELQYSLNRDSLATVQAVRQPVNNPEELHSLFDPAIVYGKGACLIRMLHQYIGDSAFRDGLRIYVKQHQYANAEANDLWTALDQATNKDVGGFMREWLSKPGHPVVRLESKNDKAQLSQQRFFANPLQAKNDDTIWPLPLLSSQISEPLLTTSKASYTTTGQPIELNRDHTGFYHTQYDSETLAKIAGLVANKKLSTVDRQGLLIDGLALARAGLQSTVDLLNLLANYHQEESYPVWQAMTSVTGAARQIINDDPQIKPLMQKYLAKLARPQFDRLGWERIKGESYFDELLRPTPIGLMAYAEVPSVVDKLLQLFDQANSPEDIKMPELRAIIYTVAVRERGRPAYVRLLEWHKNATSAEERLNLAAGITSMKDSALAKECTKLFTTKQVKLQDLVYWFIYLIRNRHGRDAAWNWMVDNWEWIRQNFKGTHDYGDYPKYAAGALSTREELHKYKEFFTPKLDENDIQLVISQGFEEIEVRALWRERDLNAIAEFLAKQKS